MNQEKAFQLFLENASIDMAVSDRCHFITTKNGESIICGFGQIIVSNPQKSKDKIRFSIKDSHELEPKVMQWVY